VAHKYTKNLSQKGYDQFVKIMQALCVDFPKLRCHVVGGYSKEDIPLKHATEQFSFYSTQPQSFFRSFYERMDIILSMPQPFVAATGIFDGFPTGACIEAGLHGVLNCLADPLDQNIALTDAEDVVIENDPQRMSQRICVLLANPKELYRLGRANWQKYRQVFRISEQLATRTRLIIQEMLREARTPLANRPVAGGVTDLERQGHVAQQTYEKRITQLSDKAQRLRGTVELQLVRLEQQSQRIERMKRRLNVPLGSWFQSSIDRIRRKKKRLSYGQVRK